MIVDNICNYETYVGLNDTIKKALDFLKSTDFRTISDGTNFEIDGKKIYAWCNTIEKAPIQDGVWEVHKSYGDIHFIVDGEETFGYDYRNGEQDSIVYNENGDYIYNKEGGNFVKLLPGDFAIVFAQEPHMPAIAENENKFVKKVVVKFLQD